MNIPIAIVKKQANEITQYHTAGVYGQVTDGNPNPFRDCATCPALTQMPLWCEACLQRMERKLAPIIQRVNDREEC